MPVVKFCADLHVLGGGLQIGQDLFGVAQENQARLCEHQPFVAPLHQGHAQFFFQARQRCFGARRLLQSRCDLPLPNRLGRLHKVIELIERHSHCLLCVQTCAFVSSQQGGAAARPPRTLCKATKSAVPENFPTQRRVQ